MSRVYSQRPACAGHADRRIISFIEDYKVIDKIIAHLKLNFKAERPPPPESQMQLLRAVEEIARKIAERSKTLAEQDARPSRERILDSL